MGELEYLCCFHWNKKGPVGRDLDYSLTSLYFRCGNVCIVIYTRHNFFQRSVCRGLASLLAYYGGFFPWRLTTQFCCFQKKKKAHHFKKHYSAKKPKLKRKKHSTIPCKCIDQTNSAWKNKCKSKRNSKFWKRMTALLNEIKGHKLCDTHEKLLAERLGFKTGNFTKLKIRIKNFQQIQTSYRILSTTLTDSCRSQWRKKLNKKINLWKE